MFAVVGARGLRSALRFFERNVSRVFMHEKLHENIENEALSRCDYASLSSSVMNLFKVVAVCLYLDSVSSNEGYTLDLCNLREANPPKAKHSQNGKLLRILVLISIYMSFSLECSCESRGSACAERYSNQNPSKTSYVS